MASSQRGRWLLTLVLPATIVAGLAALLVFFYVLPVYNAKARLAQPSKVISPDAGGGAGKGDDSDTVPYRPLGATGAFDLRNDLAAVEPELLPLAGSYTLRVQKTKVALPGAARDDGPEMIDVITYNGRLVGPTIRAKRGSTFKINLINDLPAAGAPSIKVLPNQNDPPGFLYTTNLHTHGLHVSPENPSDDIFREISPGSSFEYSYTIPADHPAGTFWYHPHMHGSVAFQIANGMAGALIVEGNSQGTVRDLDDVPEIAKAKERILVLQQLTLQRDKEGVGYVDPNDVYGLPDPKAYRVTAINGVVMPTYHMRPKEVQRWRIIHAGREEESLQLLWHKAGKDLPLLGGTTVGLMGSLMGDGALVTASSLFPKRVRMTNWAKEVAFDEIAHDGLATGTRVINRLMTMFPGNRTDALVMAPKDRGIYYLFAASENEFADPALGPSKVTTKPIAKLVVDGPELPMALPTAAHLVACRPHKAIAAAECTFKRDLVFNFDEKEKFFHINGVSFSKQAGPQKMRLGSAEEWTLTSLNGQHPFHIHVNPFQVVRYENLETKKVVIPEDDWRDTLAVPKGTRITIRTRFTDFPGKTVVHCHTLDHEDQGMMQTILIVDPKRAAGAVNPAEELTTCSIPAPSLNLPMAENKAFALDALRPKNVIVVFFQGMSCSHCTQQLRNLLRESRELADSKIAIVAISSEPIAETEKARRALEVSGGLPLQLFTDESHGAFRAFGCYDQKPRHGLFVIDKEGTIRAKYVGEAPFGYPAAVRMCVRELLSADRKVPGQTNKQDR